MSEEVRTPSSHDDAIQVSPMSVSIDATALVQSKLSPWHLRCRELNSMLGDATHLLRVPSDTQDESTWYAGAPGVSLAAGIERMAVEHEAIRDAIVVLPFDQRIYAADVQSGLVRGEWMLYEDALKQRISEWRMVNRNFVVLTGGGKQEVDLPNSLELPIDMDVDALIYEPASLAMLKAGMIRWRDLIAGAGVVAMATLATVGAAWWQSVPDDFDMAQLAAVVIPEAPPMRMRGAVDLVPFVEMTATHDAGLWRLGGVESVAFDPATNLVQAKSASGGIVAQTELPRATGEETPTLQPYLMTTLVNGLNALLDSDHWSATIAEPYTVGRNLLEAHLDITVGDADESGNATSADSNQSSVAVGLIELVRRIDRLPVGLHSVVCDVTDGRIQMCKLKFALRGQANLNLMQPVNAEV